MIAYTFTAKVWRSGAGAGWFFVTLPADVSQRVRTLTEGQRKAFGSLRVTARIGKTPWKTSIFADTKIGAFVLPVKGDVRRKEKIVVGDDISVVIEVEP